MSLRTTTRALFAALALLTACAESGPVGPVEDDVGIPSLSSHTSTVTLHPIAHGNWITARSFGCAASLGQWDCVNDQPGNQASGDPVSDDGDATMLVINGKRAGTPKSSFRLDAGQLPAGFTVSEMIVVARAASTKARGRGGAIRPFLRLDAVSGPDVPCPAGSTDVSGTAYTTISCTFSGSSLTSLPEIGFEETGGGEIKVTQMYAVVGY